MIDTLRPMLLSEERQPFDREGWGYEIKFDGWRMLAQAGALGVELRTRNGSDCTRWFPEVANTLKGVTGKGVVLDCEACVLDELGRSDFNAMDARAKKRGWVPGGPSVVLCVFDCLVGAGKPILDKPLKTRKKQLERLRGLDGVLVVDHLEGDGMSLWSVVQQIKLEGMVAKRLDSPYMPGERSTDWVKVKRTGAVSAQRFKRDPLA